ncbi:uncharacterized protein GGS25DRAFT_297947 [Hypoxylon fragiforme]|uniref:uncharacterized protein n=1 Tax=Hypoxylon fragiforme TaxID=63214 RepID=UPI0020C6D908|nr:uncharacterized protein GGS25DRAFT_297947 [Hypoxylon fragiforme]KAI2608961.1 hypothetical protein GGS25DRAFT_297947 [Hypoxylon fragiforme]
MEAPAKVVVDHTQITILLVVSTILTAISAVLVITRTWIRFIVLKRSGMDDYMALGALLFSIGYLIILYIGKNEGMGSPMTVLTLDEMGSLLKITFAIEILYYSIIGCVKASIVFMYDRFAISNGFKHLCVSTNILMLVFFLASIGVVVGQCRPLRKAWDITFLAPGSCINTTAFFYFTSSFGILLDVWIIVLPIPTLKKLQVSKRDRRVLYGVFGIGLLATACSCARLYSIHTFTMAEDPFRDSILVNLWSIVEVNVAIWCACAPALKPLFHPQRFLDSGKSSSRNRNYKSLTLPRSDKKDTLEHSTSQSYIMSAHSGNHSSSARETSPGPEDIELGLPKQAHVQ